MGVLKLGWERVKEQLRMDNAQAEALLLTRGNHSSAGIYLESVCIKRFFAVMDSETSDSL
jgi:hypothetical protein